ncbi:alpha-(1,6)-fucosyltransferase-like [Mercenaria mercenaria]|uniref:alpha-(1,6)-fucosyltransferase-like n=1 Tax=Mercenaria mercenaria TaxID=6596 RepID=UPI00234F95F8|nr:alpha-(1,6)-fucosyltransferase-like [Mercenaria mercenaria]
MQQTDQPGEECQLLLRQTPPYDEDFVKGRVQSKNLNNIAHIKVIELPLMQHLSYRPTYLPLAIPEDLAINLIRVHRNPSVWWVGQFVTYLTRPNQKLQKYFQQRQEKLVFQRPVVGIHVRRTDKVTEADYLRLKDYMEHVDKWFNMHLKNLFQSRYIYLATDDPDVLKEAENKYANYTFLYDVEASTIAKRTRYTEASLKGILFDVHMLSLCDFVICTMSSNVCRLVYELMQLRDGEASSRILSLDIDYYFNRKGYVKMKRFVQSFKQTGTSTINMEGFALVNDKRSNPSMPIFTTDNKSMRVAMPVYSERK